MKLVNQSKHLSIYLFVFLGIVETGCANDKHPLSYLSEREWVIDGFYQDNAQCKNFVNDLKNDITKIEIIQPAVETTNWDDSELQKYLKGCKKEDFTQSEQMSKMSMGGGEYIWVKSGKKTFNMERFAVWPSLINIDNGEYMIVYTGPMYIWKKQKDGTMKKHFFNWGNFIEITQPGCNRIGGQNAGYFYINTKNIPERGSYPIFYGGKLHYLLLSKYELNDSSKYTVSLRERYGNGKGKGICSAKEKNFNKGEK